MTLNFLSRVTFIARFHTHTNKEVIFTPEQAWIVKVISTIIIHRRKTSKFDFSCLRHFRGTLNTFTSFEVIRTLKDPILGLKFFTFCQLEGVTHSGGTYNLLMSSLCQIGEHRAAVNLIFDGHLPDSSMLDYIVSDCVQKGKLDIAREVLARAYESRIRVNLVTYNCVLNVLVKRSRVDDAVCFFGEQHLRFGFRPDTCSFNILVRGLCRVREVGRAFEFFNDMGSFDCSPDVVTYNTLVNGLFRVNEVDRGRELLKEMQLRSGISPDVVTYTSAISGFCKLGKMDEASVLFNEMVSFGIRPSSFTYNVLIHGFGKAGDMDSALAMYEKMLLTGCSPDVVTLTSLIDGYCRMGEVDEAMKLWHDMGTRNISPNAYTFAILINALCKENKLKEAHWFLLQLQQKRVVPQPFLYNPVLDGFCKAGNVDGANAILMEMEEYRCIPDKLTYTILIIGHCMKGRMLEAVNIFKKMLSSGCAPDSITTNSLRSRLLKAGMPSEANQLLFTISEKEFDSNLSSSTKINSLRKKFDIPVAV